MNCLKNVSEWNEVLAQQIESDIESEILRLADVELRKWIIAYNMVIYSGFFGPFAPEDRDDDNIMNFAEAEDIVHKVVQGCKFKSYEYTDHYCDDTPVCSECGSANLCFVKNQCKDCKIECEYFDYLPNAILEGSTIRNEKFAQYFKIYGK